MCPIETTEPSTVSRTYPDVLAEVKRLVRKITSHGSLDENTPLVSSNVLDSLSAISLIKSLEDELKIQFKDEDISIERFETSGGIARLCLQRLTERPTE